jgi:hypothetical protein
VRASSRVCSNVSAVRTPAATRQPAASTIDTGCSSTSVPTISTSRAASENRIGTSSAAKPRISSAGPRRGAEPARAMKTRPIIHMPSTQLPSV